jgi:hypothetical protein
VYLLVRWVLGLAVLVFRTDLAKDRAGRVPGALQRVPPAPGIAQRVPDGKHDGGHLAVTDLDRGRIYRKPVLGGLINEYSRAA